MKIIPKLSSNTLLTCFNGLSCILWLSCKTSLYSRLCYCFRFNFSGLFDAMLVKSLNTSLNVSSPRKVMLYSYKICFPASKHQQCQKANEVWERSQVFLRTDHYFVDLRVQHISYSILYVLLKVTS